jgi:selenocysteine lyase/cysteine desulfurase
MSFDVEAVRRSFPSLAVEHEAAPRIYLDNPAGTQVPRQTIEAVTAYYGGSNANIGMPYRSSMETV